MSKKSKATKARDGKTKDGKARDSKARGGKARAEAQPATTAAPAAEVQESSASTARANAVPQGEADAAPAERKSKTLTDREVTLISKALADPTRMAVLRSIAKGGATCGDLRTCSQISAATLSHHMKELESAGLIETERKGRFLSASLQRRTWKSYVDELKSFSK